MAAIGDESKSYIPLVACRGCGVIRMETKQCRCPTSETWPVKDTFAVVDEGYKGVMEEDLIPPAPPPPKGNA